MELYDNIQKTLSKKNINLVVGDIYDQQQIWEQWYRGNVNDFHYYTQKVAGKDKRFERKTLNMPKKFCEDITKLLWTEKTQINLDSDKKTKKLWEILDSKANSFTVNFPLFIEKTMAIGTGVLIEYKNEENETIIDYLDGTVVIPYKYTNSYISGLITVSRFIEQEKKEKVYFTHITYHEYTKGVYFKTNELYKSKAPNELGKEIEFASKFPNVVETEAIETETPRFQILKPNIANNLDLDNPMGISIFANSLDIFKSIDVKYDSFCNEFALGKKRILVDPTAMKAQLKTDTDGNINMIQYFDENDTTFVGINGMEDQPTKEIDFNLRVTEHVDAINADINYASANMGLGANWFKFGTGGVKTATEVVSENSEAFRTKVHYDIIVNDVVYDLVKVICEMDNIPSKNITIIPDDSIISDKNTERQYAQQEVNAGLMSKYTYLTQFRGLSDKEALEEMQQIQNESLSNAQAFGLPVGEDENNDATVADDTEETNENEKLDENTDKEE